MSQRHSHYARKPDEEYNTPAWVAVTLAWWLRKHALHVWEPAPGRGQLARALVACGFSVVETTGDFLSLGPPNDRIDAIVTNPPYGRRGELAEAFVYHALPMDPPILALLLRVDYDSAKTRRRLFADCPFFAGKIVLLDRIDWFARPGKAGSSTNHAWFIWDRAHRGRPWISYAGREAADGRKGRPNLSGSLASRSVAPSQP